MKFVDSPPLNDLTADTFPRWVLWALGGLIAFSLISVGLVRITGNGPDQLAADVTTERLLRFEDHSDGGVAVIDGQTGQLLAVLTGEQGFLRGTVRALARERRSRNLGSEMPFQLIARTDGRLTLFDPMTGHRVDLESFGPSNAGVFAPFLTMQPVTAQSSTVTDTRSN
jgi:putative photosynthetic complex assembly protein